MERNHKNLSRNKWKRNEGKKININKSRSLFFERINKTDKSLARLLKKKVNKSRNEKGDVTTDFTEIRDYYE